jgi:acetyltransferase-like isoleucine patch superfamily enzyme
MNLDFQLQSLLGCALCRPDARARLLPSARIRNMLDDSSCTAIGGNGIVRAELLISATARHEEIRQISTHGQPWEIALDGSWIRICDDAWIGAGAMVMRGVTAGEGGIVAGNADVLIRELPADAR